MSNQDKRTSELTELTSLAASDLLYVVDVSDVTDSEAGSSRKVQAKNLRFWEQTAAEVSAGVTPTNYQYEPGNVLRYGANTTPGTTDMTTAIQNADTVAEIGNYPLVIPKGTYRTTSTINITAETLITHDVTIIKDIDDSEVVRFKGLSGTAGDFRTHIGYLYVRQSSTPTTGQTSAHGFVMEDVIHATFNHLEARRCAYGLVNDSTAAGGATFWGCVIAKLHIRGCVQGFIDLPFSGSGAHTENYICNAYLNGKEWDSATLLTLADAPIRISNMEGLSFGNLNLEHTQLTSGDHFIEVRNDSTLQISAFHFEGNKKADTGSHGIFYVLNDGAKKTSIDVRNMHINNFTQTSSGTLSVFFADTASVGQGSIQSFSGTVAGNTFTDFRLLDTDGPFTCVLGAESGWDDYITTTRKGTNPSSKRPNLWFGSQSYESGNTINNPGADLDVGQAEYVQLTGTSSADITTISAAARNLEYTRIITIENDTGSSISVAAGGNLKVPLGLSLPFTLTDNGVLVVSMNITDDKASIITVT